MEIGDPEIVQLELKYCERCGSLWLRLQGAPDVYCAGCAEEMLGLPFSRKPRAAILTCGYIATGRWGC